MWQTGAAKKDITCFIKGVGLFGYGMHFHRAYAVETPLFARAFTFKNPQGKKCAYICAEIMSCTTAVRKGVVKILTEQYSHLGYHAGNVMIAGTHTHSAPGGYSHYALYNITVSGFVPKVYHTIVNGIVEAIVEADKNMIPGKIYFGTGDFAPDIEVAFNRSMKAYNNNADVAKIDEQNCHLAVHRKMYLLRMDDMQGNTIGCINWFGVHTTSVGNDYNKICADNKGYAAEYFEDFLKNKSSGTSGRTPITAFAQESCGDVSPNFIWSRKRGKMCGKYVNDYESAKYNGKLQFEKAKEIYEKSVSNELKNYEIDCGLLYENFDNIPIDDEFSNNKQNQTSGLPCLGVAFFEGTTDGWGISGFLGNILRVWIAIVKKSELYEAKFLNEVEKNKILKKYRTQGKKDIMMETAERRILGTASINRLIAPGWADKTIFYLKKQYNSGGLKDKPWTPDVLPSQIFILGNIAVAGVPGEISTVSGARLRNNILNALKKRGIETAFISSYTNAYSGYITTYEEYQTQCYEGGHTMYGEWTHAAHQTMFKKLSLAMLKKQEERDLKSNAQPMEFTDEDLKKRMFDESEYVK